MKRILCTFLGLLMAFSAYGGNHSIAPFTGWFIGLGAGEVINQTDFFIDTQTPTDNNIYIDRLSYDPHQYSNDFTGAVFAGYNRTFDSMYIAAQVSASYAERKNTINGLADDRSDFQFLRNKASMCLNSFEIDLDLLPGYMINPCTLFYARIGLTFNELTFRSDSFVTTDSGTISVKLKKETNKVGIRLGAGIEEGLSKKVSLRADYIYTYYGKTLNVKGEKSLADIGEADDSLLNIAHAEYNDQQVLASLVVHL